MNNNYVNPVGKPFSSINWLDKHHSIKSRVRAELICKLPISPNSKILDMGCGTGQWSFLLAEKVGHKGIIVGVDQDNESIKLAKEKLSNHYLKDSISFKCEHIEKFNTDIKFDLIVLFNSLSYLSNPLKFINTLPKYLKKNGAILIKDTDLGSDFFWPIDIDLYHKLMIEINQSNQKKIGSYDPFFARKIPLLLSKSYFSKFETILQSFSFTYPLDKIEREYITNNANILYNLALQNKNTSEINKWAKQFDHNSNSCIFDKPDFLYTMTDFLFYARMPSNL